MTDRRQSIATFARVAKNGALAVYLFGLALCLITLTLVVSAVQAGFRVARRVFTLREATFSVSVKEARPGESIEARAHVVPRPASRAVDVQARLTCTMFDHSSHELYASSRTMRARGEAAGSSPRSPELSAKLTLPEYALRTGLVGDKSPDAVEGGRRMLVAWTVDFEVRSATGKVLCRESRGVDVPRGRRPKTHLRRMSLLAIDAFTSIRNDMLLNKLVHLAICDGPVNPGERRFIHDLLDEMAGMAASAYTDARIEHEQQRSLELDDLFLGRYLPMEARLEFYRALHGLARCDGAINAQEAGFLAAAAQAFRLTDDDVKSVQREGAADEAVPIATS